MRMRAKGRGVRARGNTLIELLVVIAILGIVAGVTGLGFRTPPPPLPATDASARIAGARREAIRSGKAITVTVLWEGETMAATLHPDGRVIADAVLLINPLTGRLLP